MTARWVIAGTPLEDTYPCRCHERPDWAVGRRDWTCSPAWCPCGGQDPDGKPPECCSWRVGPAQVVMAKAAWELARRQREEMLG